MNLLITATDDSPSSDELNGLWTWLAGRHDPYRVDGRYGPPATGTLGGTLDALSVALASGGAVTVLVSGIIEWIRNGRGGKRGNVPLAITIKNADGAELVIETEVVTAWSATELTEQVERLVSLLHKEEPEGRR